MGKAPIGSPVTRPEHRVAELRSCLEALCGRLVRQAVTVLKREKWRLEVWYAYYRDIAPEELRRKKRADDLIELFGDPPEKLPERNRGHYYDAIHEIAHSAYSDRILQNHYECAKNAGGVERRARSIPSQIRKPLMTIAAIHRAAERSAEELARSMPEIERQAKKARREFIGSRDKSNQRSAQEADRRKQYYNKLAEPYRRKNPRLSKAEIARLLVRNHRKQIKQDLGVTTPSVNTIRQLLEKPAS